jgi:hypothetical protein
MSWKQILLEVSLTATAFALTGWLLYGAFIENETPIVPAILMTALIFLGVFLPRANRK